MASQYTLKYECDADSENCLLTVDFPPQSAAHPGMSL